MDEVFQPNLNDFLAAINSRKALLFNSRRQRRQFTNTFSVQFTPYGISRPVRDISRSSEHIAPQGISRPSGHITPTVRNHNKKTGQVCVQRIPAHFFLFFIHLKEAPPHPKFLRCFQAAQSGFPPAAPLNQQTALRSKLPATA